MTKKFLTFLMLISATLFSCKIHEEKMDFYVGSATNEIFEIDESTLTGKILTSKETFALATHDGDSCLCWTNFAHVLKLYNEDRKNEGKSYIPFFSIDTSLFEESTLNDLEIEKVKSGYTEFYLFRNGEKIEKFSSVAKKDSAIFTDLSSFKAAFRKYIGAEPIKNLYLVNKEYIQNNIFNATNDKSILFTIRSGCSDCSYCIPNILIPFLKSSSKNIPIYIFDIQGYRSNVNEYEEIKDFLKLTSKYELGYKAGYVPTYQYYENSVLKEAGVFANDAFIEETVDNIIGTKITDSYFNGIISHSYTNKNLVGTFMSGDTNIYSLHEVILLEFLNYYCK